MATYIFQNITSFKEHVGGAVNQSLSLNSLKPWVEMATQDHIIGWLGKDMWDDLVAAVEADTVSPEQGNLLPYVQRPVALLSMYEYSKIGTVQFGEGGMYRQENEGLKSPYKYQEEAYRKQMIHHGYESIERMLVFLEDNEADYPLWQADSAYQRNKTHFINTAVDFRQRYGKQLGRYLFEQLRPIINEVELFAILPTIGQDQYDDLKEGILLKALSADEQELIGLIQNVVVHFTMQEALERHWVQFEGNRVVQLESLEPKGFERAGSAANTPFSIKWQHHRLLANRHISYVRHYLESRLDLFPLYAAHLAEEVAAASETSTATDEELYYSDRYFGAFPIHGGTDPAPKVNGIKNI